MNRQTSTSVNWIIPMAGKGTRTRELGAFKPFIQVGDKRVIEWLLVSLTNHLKAHDRVIFVTTEAFEEEFDVQNQLKDVFAKMGLLVQFQLLFAKDTPPGPAASVYLTKPAVVSEWPAIVVNVDQYIQFQIPSAFFSERCGFLPIYAEFGTKSSYVEVKEGLIVRVVEKDNISNLASGGVYGFSSAELMYQALDLQFSRGTKVKDEDYVGPSFNFLIEQDIPIYPTSILAKFDLGSVDGIADFKGRMIRALW